MRRTRVHVNAVPVLLMLETLAFAPAGSAADTKAISSSFAALVEKSGVVTVIPVAWLSWNARTSIASGNGLRLLDGDDSGPVPAILVARTVKVYVVPFVNPVIVIGLVVPVAVIPPGFEITV